MELKKKEVYNLKEWEEKKGIRVKKKKKKKKDDSDAFTRSFH